MKLIGVSGYARSGKDSVVGMLEQHGYTRVAFADRLREAVYRLNPHLPLGAGSAWRLQDEVDTYGWEEAKGSEEVRRLLQVMGTEVCRELFGQNAWVDAAFAPLDPQGQYSFSDVRFPNEADEIVRRGGYLIRVERPGVVAANAHPSEHALVGYPHNFYLQNNGTLEDLATKVNQIATYLKGKHSVDA